MTASIKKRLQHLRALVLDVDGVLTDAKIWFAGEGHWRRQFSLRDGYGIVKLQGQEFIVGVITASNSEDIQHRIQNLRIRHFYQGSLDKVPAFDEFLQKTGLTEKQVAYMGDDEPDLPLLKRAGFAVTVPGGIAPARRLAHYVTKLEGGNGAVREVCDLIFNHADFFKPAPRSQKRNMHAQVHSS